MSKLDDFFKKFDELLNDDFNAAIEEAIDELDHLEDMKVRLKEGHLDIKLKTGLKKLTINGVEIKL